MSNFVCPVWQLAEDINAEIDRHAYRDGLISLQEIGRRAYARHVVIFRQGDKRRSRPRRPSVYRPRSQMFERVKELNNLGWTVAQIAQSENARPATIYSILWRAGIKTNYKPPWRTKEFSERDLEIVERVRSGEKPGAVAKHYGISRERVRQIVARSTVVANARTSGD